MFLARKPYHHALSLLPMVYAGAAPSLRVNLRALSTQDSNSVTLDTTLQAEIMSKCEDISNKFIQPLNDRLKGPLDKSASGGYKTTKLPFVFVLGNHSSGERCDRPAARACAHNMTTTIHACAAAVYTALSTLVVCCDVLSLWRLIWSGKSSFINYCIGRSIQTTGVAPTDDSFTIIAP
jgi:hypothetical protein